MSNRPNCYKCYLPIEIPNWQKEARLKTPSVIVDISMPSDRSAYYIPNIEYLDCHQNCEIAMDIIRYETLINQIQILRTKITQAVSRLK